MAALRGCGDIDEAAVPLEQAVQARRGVVAQHGVLAAGLDRGEEAALRGDVAVAHGVHPTVKGVEMALPHQDLDLLGAQAAREELGVGDDTPLARGELRERAGGDLRPCVRALTDQ